MVAFADDPECKFAIVPATIESVSDTTVAFTTRGAGVAGNPDQNLRKSFTVPLAEVHTSPIDGAPPPVAMAPGATGNLYLSRTGWKTITADGYGIFGLEHAIFKWPRCAGVSTPVLTNLSVVPTSIVVRGHLDGENTLFDIELLGPDAATSQDVVWNGAELIDLRLTPAGARRLRRDANTLTVRVWPIRITVKGAPAIDPALCGEADILDREIAGCSQHIAFTEQGSPVTLSLTQDGVNAFHVTPQLVAELSTEIDAGRRPPRRPRRP